MRWSCIAFLAALLLAGCAGPAATQDGSSGAPTSTIQPLGPGGLVNKTITLASGLSPMGDVAQVSVPGHRTSEFTVAKDPRDPMHLIAAGMDWDSPDGTVQCTAFVSKDGGGTWTAVAGLPGHVGTNEDTDPWIAIDAKGRAYLTCTEGGAGLLLGTSEDGGFTWDTAKVVPTGGTAAKDAIGAFGDGELYLCYQNGGLNVLHSNDAGGSWTQSSFSTPAGCNGVVQGPEGNVYVVWQGAGAIEADNLMPAPPAFGVVATADHGRTWSSTTLSTDLGSAPQNFPDAPQAAAPSIAVSNRTGTLFVAAQTYQNAEIVGPLASATEAAGLLERSRDGGRSFTELAMPAFPTEACGSGCNLVHPTIAVDDAGRLIMEATLSSSDSLHKEVWMTLSNDEGDSWVTPVRLALTEQDQSYLTPGNVLPDPQAIAQDAQDIASNPGKAPGAANAIANHETWAVFHRDGGEYFGITSTPGVAVGLWVQHDSNGKNVILGQRVQILTT